MVIRKLIHRWFQQTDKSIAPKTSQNHQRGRYRPILEALEDRLAPALAIDPYDYTAGPGEFNDVVISPGTPFSSIQDAPDVNQITALPFVASRFLDGLGIGIDFSVGFALEDPGPEFGVGIGIGFPLYPFGLPEGVLGPPFASTGTGGFDANQLIGNAVQKAVGGVSSAVAGVPLPAGHTTGDGVDFEVRAVNGNTLPGYRLFQAVVDPGNTVAESEANDTAGTANAISPREIVTGAVMPGSGDFDVFRFDNTSGGDRFYSVVVDNNPDGDTNFTGTKVSILVDAGGGTNPTLARSNVTFGDANAVGPVSVATGSAVYVVIENSGAGADTDGDYRFVLIENNLAADQVNETESNDDQSSTDALADRTDFAFGTIPSQLDRDFFRAAEGTDSGGAATSSIDAGDLIFAFVDVVGNFDGSTAEDRKTNELDSFLTVFEPPSSGGAQIAEDDNDGPAMPATTFDQIQNEIKNLIDFDSLLTEFSGPITVTLLDGNDNADLSRISGNVITVDGGTGHDTILHGGGVNTLIGGDDNDTFVFNNLFSASVTIDGGAGFDTIEIPGSGANKIITILLADDPSANDPDGDIDDLLVTVASDTSTVSTFYRDIAASSVEALSINTGDGDDIVTIDFSAGVLGFSAGISVGGEGGTDELRVIEGALGHNVIFRQFGPSQHSGSLQFVGGDSISYESVEEWSITPLNSGTGGLGTDGVGRILVFHQDPLEFNDDRTTATTLEATGNLITDLAIDLPEGQNQPGDEDWYVFRAPKTSTYSFDIFFRQLGALANGNPGLPDDGNLAVSVFRSDGVTNIVNGAATLLNNGETNLKARFSTQENNVYYIRVRGATTDAVNKYSLRFEEIDTVGPQVFDPDNGGPTQAIQVVTDGVANTLFDIFLTKPASGAAGGTPVGGPTPLVNGLLINVRDIVNSGLLPRQPGDPYVAVDPVVAGQIGHYKVIGDRVGAVAIESVDIVNAAPVAGQLATATIQINFAEALPDDRFTLEIGDSLLDPPGNRGDGESKANEPGVPTFPSGNGAPGGAFSARFTVDSRPEIAAWKEERVQIDINGNGVWDPDNADDATNHDISFNLGLFTDHAFSGNFAPVGAATASGFDKLGAYGRFNGVYRFLLDFNHDGAPDASIPAGLPINGTPVAGNFTDGHAGDEVGLFDGSIWYLDTSGDNNITSSPLDAKFSNGLRGHPIVGDFDGDGTDDLATYQPDNDLFQFDLRFNGFGSVDATVAFGFPGVAERPVAADMNNDGVDDIGLWVPNSIDPAADAPADWYFLVSTGNPVTGAVNTLLHSFTPEPFGNDLFFRYGSSFAQPLVGNYDPPISTASASKGYDLAVHSESGYNAHSFAQADITYVGSNSSAGLVNRYLTDGTYYWGGLINRGGTVSAEIWRRLDGQWTKLAGVTVNMVSGRVRFETTGDSLKLFLDQSLIAFATDSLIGAGWGGTYLGIGSSLENYIGGPVAYNTVTNPYAAAFDGSDGSPLNRDWFESSGVFQTDGNQLTGLDDYNVATLYSYPETQWAVEADVEELSPGGSFGLLSRYRSADELYWGGVADRSGTINAEMWRRFGGQWTKLSSANIGTAIGRLRFETTGSSLQLYQDGNVLLRAVDDAIQQGTAGIWASGDTTIDDFWAGQVNYNTVALDYADAFDGTGGDFLSRNWYDPTGAFQYQANQLAGGGNLNIAVLSGVIETNVAVESDFAQLTPNRSAGLIARYLDENNMYWGGVVNRFGLLSAEIWRKSGGVWTRLTSNAVGGGLGRLRFSVTGSSLELSLGASVVSSTTDGVITAGGSVGIYGSQGVLFNDFEAKKI